MLTCFPAERGGFLLGKLGEAHPFIGTTLHIGVFIYRHTNVYTQSVYLWAEKVKAEGKSEAESGACGGYKDTKAEEEVEVEVENF